MILSDRIERDQASIASNCDGLVAIEQTTLFAMPFLSMEERREETVPSRWAVTSHFFFPSSRSAVIARSASLSGKACVWKSIMFRIASDSIRDFPDRWQRQRDHARMPFLRIVAGGPVPCRVDLIAVFRLIFLTPFLFFFQRRDDRVAEGARLEIVCALIPHRGFDSHSLRHSLLYWQSVHEEISDSTT